ncbi:hypothetical protein SELMODRAFT_428799 [Selaginella moellendorffii]|uniref:Uncharacterized protein n=1 Tax=Selaginella moellendorffii TaxID=88036 RepID=D8T415_SELML|nr:hypothetical protein SELMODRAFT_428799 [Selaginella moellendorffii]
MERLIIRNNRLVRDDGKKRGRYEDEEAKGGKAMIKRTKMDQQLQDKETKGEQEYLKACFRGGPTLVRLSFLNPAKVEATREIKFNPAYSFLNPAKVEATREIKFNPAYSFPNPAKVEATREIKFNPADSFPNPAKVEATREIKFNPAYSFLNPAKVEATREIKFNPADSFPNPAKVEATREIKFNPADNPAKVEATREIKFNPADSFPNPAKVEATREMPMRREVKSKATKQLETSMTMEIECEPVDKVKGGNKVAVHASGIFQVAKPLPICSQHVKTSRSQTFGSVTCSNFTNANFLVTCGSSIASGHKT